MMNDNMEELTKEILKSQILNTPKHIIGNFHSYTNKRLAYMTIFHPINTNIYIYIQIIHVKSYLHR